MNVVFIDELIEVYPADAEIARRLDHRLDHLTDRQTDRPPDHRQPEARRVRLDLQGDRRRQPQPSDVLARDPAAQQRLCWRGHQLHQHHPSALD